MKLRYEKKYLVPNEKVELLRKRILPFMVPDGNGGFNSTGIPEYTVRSIYLDSYDMECYHQKESGIKLRRKLRIRGYGQCHEESRVVLEIKRKIGGRIRKHRSQVFFRNMMDLIHSGNVDKFVIKDGYATALDDARRFFFHLKKKQYSPVNLVAYEREAYHGKFNYDVRVTFDKNIRSKIFPSFEALYDDNGLKSLFNNHFVMEIKYFTVEMPGWLRSVVHEFGLRNDAISKYTIGYDVGKHNRKLTY